MLDHFEYFWFSTMVKVTFSLLEGVGVEMKSTVQISRNIRDA